MAQVGFHTSMEEVGGESYKEGVRLYQIMLGNPRTYKSRVLTEREKRDVEDKGIDLVCHGPYVTSLVSPPNEKLGSISRKYYYNLTRNCIRSGISYIVAHVGGKKINQSVREEQMNLATFLTQWLMDFGGKDIILCLETDSGSKNGRMCGGVRFLYPIIKNLDSPQIRLCFDLEHAYANGLDIENYKVIDQIFSITDIFHFNAIPSYVERGSHLDRHSDENFIGSKFGGDVYRNILDIADKKEHLIRVILERRGWDVAKPDRDLIRSWKEES